ncbi:MAG: hypothetical protein WA125_13800 [Desulfosporosinus sp.]
MARQMFNQETNRLDYGELLLPDVEYNMDFAVGLTYSLDLEALLGVPVSLGLLDCMDSSHMQSPFFLLEAIRKSSDKIAIFCNAGCIKLPQRIEPVYALLENSVFEVSLTKKANFHPKLWVIRYSDAYANSYIKVITLSRNLTFDRSFDVAAEMMGIIGDTVSEHNRPLSDLLRFVAAYLPNVKSRQIKTLARDVLKVSEFELAEPFESYAFHPFGIPGHKGAAEMLLSDANNLMVISPFLSDGVVEKLTAQPTNKTLITRKSSVSPKILHCFDDVFITKDVVMDNALLEESDHTTEAKRDIHAKLYFKNNFSGNYLFLGSLNASDNAFYHNVEFLLELKFKPRYASYQSILNDFLPAESSPFEPLLSADEYQSENDEEESDSLSDVVDALQSAYATLCNDRYSVTVHCNKLASPAEIATLFRPRSFVPLDEATQLPELLLKELSEFYIIRRSDTYAVVKIHTEGIPYKERDNAIYNAVIGSKSGFLAFVAFMLTDNYSETSMEQRHFMDALRRGETSTDTIPAALYERLLRTTAANPRKLDDIENVMQRLGPDIVTDDFRSLLATFRTAVKKVKRK